MEYILQLDPAWDNCPNCWRKFIRRLRDNLCKDDYDFLDDVSINDELSKFNGEVNYSCNYVVFETPADYIAFLLAN